MGILSALFILAVGGFSLAAAVTDWRTRRIPNWLTVSALVTALVVHTASKGLAGMGFALLGFAAGFGILLVMWLLGGSGGGDVKMMGALGAWLGAALTLQVFLVSAAVVALASAALFLYAFARQGLASMQGRRGTHEFLGKQKPDADESSALRNKAWRFVVPYALPAALGTWVVLAVAWKTGSLPM